MIHRHPTHRNAALALQNAVQMQNERGLAGAIGAEQRHGFAGMEREIDAIQRLRSILVLEAKVANLDERRHWTRTRIRKAEAASTKTPSATPNRRESSSGNRPVKARASMARWIPSARW